MTAEETRLVRASFESLVEYGEALTLLFYGRLFELAPEVRSLFKPDLREQSKKLLETLAVAVNALDNFDALRPMLRELGRAHVDYGVKPEYYPILRTALVWAVGTASSGEFDAPTRTAWTSLLEEISAEMLLGASSLKRG